MTETSGRGRATLVEGNVEFDDQDASLLRAIHRAGSVAGAATELGRSRARALSRIQVLEDAFGTLVERRRGGDDGGGSQLTEQGVCILDRYERLEVALDATAQVPENVLSGPVAAVGGELATVDTSVGTLRGLHGGIAVGDPVQVQVGADAVTIHDTSSDVEPNATSARNRLRGRIDAISTAQTVFTVRIDVGGATMQALITGESATRLDLRKRDDVLLTWKATATRLTPETISTRSNTSL